MIVSNCYFKTSESFMFNAYVYINGYPLKANGNDEHDLLTIACRVSLHNDIR